MAEQYPSLAAGQRITGALLRSMLPQTARKTSDTPRSASTTATADPHLTFDVEANAVYTIHGWIKFDGDTAGDLKVQLTVPSGALGEFIAVGTGNNVVGSTAAPALQANTQGATGYLVRMESGDVNVSRNYGALGAGVGLTLIVYATVRVGSTAGTVSIDWAQAASSATATDLFTDSWLEMRRTA